MTYVWFMGAMVALGYKNGIRRTADVFFVLFWWVILPCFLVYVGAVELGGIGKTLKGSIARRRKK